MNQMNQMNQIQDDEIDLFELFQTLWDGKWVISAFIAIAVLIGSGLLLFKDPTYESKLIYTVDTIPPFYKEKKATTDFKQKFYSVSVFNDWDKSNSNKSLVFEDLSATEVVDGFVLTKDKGGLMALLSSDTKFGSFVLIKSNQLEILDSVFKYAEYINQLMKNDYIARAKDELNIIETRFQDFSTANDAIISQILTIDRYVVSADAGANVLSIQHPTMPKKISPNSFLILTISLILGGIVGVFFILARNAIKKRKELSAEV